MAIGEAEAFSERMKRELVALESANVYALMETETVVEEVGNNPTISVLCQMQCHFGGIPPIAELLFLLLCPLSMQ